MSDNRELFIQRIRTRLGIVLSPETANLVIGEITKELHDFEISERVTALTVPENPNEKILKRYVACLRIDGKSEGTIYQYARSCRKLSQCIGKPFTEMGVYDIRYFLAMEKERNVSNRSLENTRANLSAFFQWMALEDVIQKNPCLNIKPIKFTDEIRQPFSDTEIDSLRGACKSKKERAIIEVLLSTGLRVSELVSLDIGDIDLERLSCHVRHGKGDKERKTYMTTVAAKHLRSYLSERKEIHPAVFLNRFGDRIAVDGIQHILRTIGQRASVRDVHPHRFRRTFATGLAKRGMDVQEIQRLLGHTNINTTMIYVTTDESSVQMSYRKYAV